MCATASALRDERRVLAPASAPDLGEEVHLWRLDLRVFAGPVTEGWLAPEERAELASRSRPEARERYLATRAAMRAVLCRYVGGAPGALRIARGIHGKPYLEGSGSLRFNVSRSDEIVVVAVIAGAEIGVDVERVRSIRRDLQIAERFCSEDEVDALRGAPPALRARRFMELWTRLEALAKLDGEGLRGLSGRRPSAAAGTVPAVSVLAIDLPPRHTAAVAIAGDPRPVRVLAPG